MLFRIVHDVFSSCGSRAFFSVAEVNSWVIVRIVPYSRRHTVYLFYILSTVGYHPFCLLSPTVLLIVSVYFKNINKITNCRSGLWYVRSDMGSIQFRIWNWPIWCGIDQRELAPCLCQVDVCSRY